MMIFTPQLKRAIVPFILLTSFMNLILPVMAEDLGLNQQVLNNVGNGGANLNSVIGAGVVSDVALNNATIKNTVDTSYLRWNALNTGANQSLRYVLDANQISFNNVVGTSLSSFAGSLTSTGGRVIISNSNGIILENGSYTNCNALTLSTQKATWDVSNGNATNLQWGAAGNGGIQIGRGDLNNAAVVRIAEDLNIISPAGILISGADITAGNLKLITADGVNYLATGNIDTNSVLTAGANANTANFKDTDGSTFKTGKAILVKNSAIAVKDSGKVYFITKGANDKASIAAIDSAIDGKIDLAVDGDANFDLIGNIDITGSHVGGNLVANTVDKVLTLVGPYTNIKKEKITVGEYLVKTYGTNLNNTAAVKAGLRKLFPTNTSEEIALMAKKLASTYESTYTAYNHSVKTFVGGKGSVSIADTNVGGAVVANGAGVNITNVTAKTLTTNSTEGSTVESSRSDTDNLVKTTTNYIWENTAFGTKRVRVGRSYKTLTIPTAGDFTAYTEIKLIPRPLTIISEVLSNPSTIVAGTMDLSGITLKTGTSTTAANTLTATAVGDLMANNVKAGNTKLTSINGNVTAQNSSITGELAAATKNIITLNNTSAHSLIAGGDENALSESTKISIGSGSRFGTARAFAVDVDLKGASTVSGGTLNASRDIIVDNSTLNRTNANAGNDIRLDNVSVIDTATIAVGRNMLLTGGSKLVDSTATVANSMSANNSSIIGSTVNADMISVNGDAANKQGYSLNNVALKSLRGTTIDDTSVGGSLIASAQDGNVHLGNVAGSAAAQLTTNNSGSIDIANSSLSSVTVNSAGNIVANNSSIGEVKLTAGNEVGIYSSKLGATEIAATKAGIYDSTLKSATVNTAGDVEVWDSAIAEDMNVKGSVDSDVTIAGTYVGKDLTIDGANKVWIGNDTRARASGKYQAIGQLAEGMTTVSSFNPSRFSNASFDQMANGASYGDGTRISFIAGNLGITNVNDATIINTAIIGNLTESNIKNDASLITSYLGGDYEPDMDSIKDASVYKSFIKGLYTDYYKDFIELNYVDRLKFGDQLDTAFKQQFNPRGFAASDNQIGLLKKGTLSSASPGRSANSIKFSRGFVAY